MYLTDQPEATFWQGAHNRCTSFTMESILQPIPSAGWGRPASINLNRNGDMLYQQYLQVDLPGIKWTASGNNWATATHGSDPTCLDQATGNDCDCDDDQNGIQVSHADEDCLANTNYVHWTNAVGQYMIDSVHLLIGSNAADTLWGDYLFVHEELSGKVGRRLLEMVGKRYTREELICDSQQDRTLYIPLPWWFTMTSGSALPICSLSFHTVSYTISLQEVTDCIVVHNASSEDGAIKGVPCLCGTGQPVVRGMPVTISLLSTYVYLDEAERAQLTGSEKEQLMVQHQRIAFNDTTNALQLGFNHPVIELIWFLRRACNTRVNAHFNLAGTNNRDPIKAVSLAMNNQQRFGPSSASTLSENASYYRLVQPYQAHSCIPDTFVYCYSFALHPEDVSTPSGSANFSRIDNVTFTVTPQDDIAGSGYEVVVFATNWNVGRIEGGMFGVAYSS